MHGLRKRRTKVVSLGTRVSDPAHQRGLLGTRRREIAINVGMLLSGLLVLSVSVTEVATLAGNLATRAFLGSCWGIVGLVGLLMILYPVRRAKLISPVVALLLCLLRLISCLGAGYEFVAAPLITFGILVVVPMILWSLLAGPGLTTAIGERAFLYATLSIVSSVFMYRGAYLTACWFRRWDPDADLSKLLAALSPRWVRVYIYSIFALMYFIRNIEDFAGLSLLTNRGWLLYRDVTVEVLLTLVAVDAAMSARERARTGRRA